MCEVTYEVITANNKLDEGVQNLASLVHDLNVLYYDSPTPH